MYLHENPEAQDSLEGIVHWWLLERFIAEQIAEVEAAVKELVERDLVVESTAADGSRRYRLNPRLARKAAALVRGHEDEGT